MKKKILSFICALSMLFSLTLNASAVSDASLDAALVKTAEHCLKNVTDPRSGAEWVIVALCGGDIEMPAGYLADYYASMEEYVAACGGELSSTKNTEYAKAVLGITAAGYDATDVAGYDLTAPLFDYEATRRQGLNGPVFALLALDSGNYPCETRDQYVDYILSRQMEDGGWAYSGTVSDTDMTAMALQALAKYTDRSDVAAAVENGVERLSQLQRADGSYASYGVQNSESTAQVIVALCELGIALDDSRFVKNGRTLLDDLLSYQLSDGSFRHENDKAADGIATEQAFMAMVSAGRQREGCGGIYHMSERYEGPRFADISGHWAKDGILFCVDKGLFNGISDREFSPEMSMNRAMLVTVLWRLDGQPVCSGTADFTDVAAGAYYEKAIVWAEEAGITQGYGDGTFGVSDSVTRQQMALFLYRYASYKGMDISVSADLSGYTDAVQVASWAEQAMSWANGTGLVTGTPENQLLPSGNATRAQVAVILMRFVEGMK